MRAAMLTIVALALPITAWSAGPPASVTAINAVHAAVPLLPNPSFPPLVPRTASVADELIPPIPYTAKSVVFLKTFVVTATYEGKPYRIMVVVVDSQGLVYSTSQQGGPGVKDTDSQDELMIKVTSRAPIVFDLSVRKADARAVATRGGVAVGDLEQGRSAFALRENKLAVIVERLADVVDLR